MKALEFADDQALRPAAEEGDAQYRRADFDFGGVRCFRDHFVTQGIEAILNPRSSHPHDHYRSHKSCLV
jgi:hypothetical protein